MQVGVMGNLTWFVACCCVEMLSNIAAEVVSQSKGQPRVDELWTQCCIFASWQAAQGHKSVKLNVLSCSGWNV